MSHFSDYILQCLEKKNLYIYIKKIKYQPIINLYTYISLNSFNLRKHNRLIIINSKFSYESPKNKVVLVPSSGQSVNLITRDSGKLITK